jgi:DNA anti-recombination protein RmuC
MTNEEMQRAMEFIINQQGQFVMDIAKLEAKLDGLTGIVAQLATATLSRFEETDRKFDDVDRRISALVDAQFKTEENIRNLTAVVDRYFTEGRNGQ